MRNLKSIEELLAKNNLALNNLTLAPLHKIFLTTNGSLTKILEAVFGEVEVKTVKQERVKADRETAKALEIKEGEEVNYREVLLVVKKNKKRLVHAVSFAPVERIEPEFREEIMKRDLPIGKIMEKLKIEARREIKEGNVKRAGRKVGRLLRVPEDEILLERKYAIIRNNKIMMLITESIPWSFLKE